MEKSPADTTAANGYHRPIHPNFSELLRAVSLKPGAYIDRSQLPRDIHPLATGLTDFHFYTCAAEGLGLRYVDDLVEDPKGFVVRLFPSGTNNVDVEEGKVEPIETRTFDQCGNQINFTPGSESL